MNYAILSHNLEDFKKTQELLFSADIYWSDRRPRVREFGDVDYEKGSLIYISKNNPRHMTYSDYNDYINYEKDNFELVDIRNDINIEKLIKDYKIDYTQFLELFHINLYKSRKRITENKVLSFYEFISERKIIIDLEEDDEILTGRFKNKKRFVKTFGTDENGQPTINGKPMLNFRIKKLMKK